MPTINHPKLIQPIIQRIKSIIASIINNKRIIIIIIVIFFVLILIIKYLITHFYTFVIFFAKKIE
jgi:hypothetical protein